MTAAYAIEAGISLLANEAISTSKLKAGYLGSIKTYNKTIGNGSLCDQFILQAEAARSILEQRGQLSETVQETDKDTKDKTATNEGDN